MSTNLTLAFIPAITANVVGIGLSLYIFNRFVLKKYWATFKKSINSKIILVCGAIALSPFALGISQIVNELVYVFLNDSKIITFNIGKGIFNIVFYPVLFSVIAFVLIKLFGDKNKVMGNFDMEKSISTSSTSAVSKNYLAPSIAVAIVLAMALYAFSLKKQDTNEKTFTFAGCSSCDKDGCKPFDWYKTMTVTNKDVLIFYKDSDQTDRIQNLMSQPNMECTIVSNKGFAFDCHSTTFYSANNYFTKSYSFDGKKSLVHKNTSELNGHSSTIKFTCVINENSFLTF